MVNYIHAIYIDWPSYYYIFEQNANCNPRTKPVPSRPWMLTQLQWQMHIPMAIARYRPVLQPHPPLRQRKSSKHEPVRQGEIGPA